MSSLYELIGERLALQNKLQEQDFDEQTILDTLEGDSVAIQKKIEDYCYVIRNMESLPAELKAEEQRLAIRRKVWENSLWGASRTVSKIAYQIIKNRQSNIEETHGECAEIFSFIKWRGELSR